MIVGARALLGEAPAAVGIFGVEVHAVDDDEALRKAQRSLDGVGEALAHAVAHDEAVDDYLDRVLELLLQLRGVLQAKGLPVDDGAGVALASQLVDEVLVLALAPSHDG